jgi:ubiquinone/menaquinone biosynthesis C-methylase UbiE
VAGADFSEKMIEFARLEEARVKQDVSYHLLDASDLKEFSSNYFDLGTCFMSLQDMGNYNKAISEVPMVSRTRCVLEWFQLKFLLSRSRMVM